ncbi:MAG: Fic family protein [Gemmatimonadota bacterium]|nr:Fic family protein [Gemmatimonadota bacterium]MDH3423676.1 Fic family protein [Gemmatimonadota bacterium]
MQESVGDTPMGRFVPQPAGYSAFIPSPLPSEGLELGPQTIELLSGADRALGRLDGAAEVLPNPDLMVAMYSRKEALLSSQIEGTEASMVDVLEYEAGAGADSAGRPARADVQEVLNHQQAMSHGLERLRGIPISNRLLKEIHGVLMQGVRGQNRSPGEFRRTQNWIGPPGCTIEDATFVPPPVPQMHDALADLERFIHGQDRIPILIKCGLVHYQFETIHPFEDGNGRMGRLLITFLLAERQVLRRPLLYLSVYLKRHRAQYYDLLNRVRQTGGYGDWLDFFLRGVREVSVEATDTARSVLQMRGQHLERVKEEVASAYAPALIDILLRSPAITVTSASRYLEVSYQTANTIIGEFERLGIIEEMTGRERNRVFLYRPYLELLGGDLPPS